MDIHLRCLESIHELTERECSQRCTCVVMRGNRCKYANVFARYNSIWTFHCVFCNGRDYCILSIRTTQSGSINLEFSLTLDSIKSNESPWRIFWKLFVPSGGLILEDGPVVKTDLEVSIILNNMLKPSVCDF